MGREKNQQSAPANENRLTREDWLAKAMDVLAQEGSSPMRIEELAGAIGVTKGSFYWHFKDRQDFLQSLLSYWLTEITIAVIEEVRATPGSPEERLYALMDILNNERYSKFEVPIRAWAVRDAEVDAIVREADLQRLEFVRSQFAAMGLQGHELEMRTQTFVVFHSLEDSLLGHLDQTDEERQELLKRRHAFFTRK